MELSDRLEHWYRRPLGRALLDMEAAGLTDLMSKFYGYHALQVGGPKYWDFLASSPIAHKIYLDQGYFHSGFGVSVQAKYEELPFLPGSVDFILLQHVLEFSHEPKKVLHEATQILAANGDLIIIAFNPKSLWGLYHLFYKQQSGKIPWSGRFISMRRIRHWLAEFGLQVVEMRSLFFRPPLQNSHKLQRLLFMEGMGQMLFQYSGAAYILVAKKRVIGLTPLKARPVRVGGAVVKPTARVSHEES